MRYHNFTAWDEYGRLVLSMAFDRRAEAVKSFKEEREYHPEWDFSEISVANGKSIGDETVIIISTLPEESTEEIPVPEEVPEEKILTIRERHSDEWEMREWSSVTTTLLIKRGDEYEDEDGLLRPHRDNEVYINFDTKRYSLDVGYKMIELPIPREFLSIEAFAQMYCAGLNKGCEYNDRYYVE